MKKHSQFVYKGNKVFFRHSGIFSTETAGFVFYCLKILNKIVTKIEKCLSVQLN